jgi:hypothetical protein
LLVILCATAWTTANYRFQTQQGFDSLLMTTQVTYISSQTGPENTLVVCRNTSFLFSRRQVDLESAQGPSLDLSNYILCPIVLTSGLCNDLQDFSLDRLGLTRIEFCPQDLSLEFRQANGPVLELGNPSLQSGSCAVNRDVLFCRTKPQVSRGAIDDQTEP